ncbi:tyrosine-type recombinase/integrase [Streptomyces sp. NPDC059752]|uniref:tyrosine-type recombinase/integrase n=1 Tax=unclassified Streptomyces TaxID=2593676 RepID=UPI00365CF5A3
MSSIKFDEKLQLSGRQRDNLLEWVGRRQRNGSTLRLFFSVVAFAALRPAEALGLRVRDVKVLGDGAGVLIVNSSSGESADWEKGGMGKRRLVPVCSQLLRMLKRQIAERGLGPDDALIVREGGRPLSGVMYRRAWTQACEAARDVDGADFAAGVNISVLRDSCIAGWLGSVSMSLIEVVEIAERAGVSVCSLYLRYPFCFQCTGEIPWDRLEAAFALD